VAPRISDLLTGESSKETQASGSAAEGLEEVGKAAEEMSKVFPSVGAGLDDLQQQLKKNIKVLDEARRRGVISEKEATASLQSMNDALERVNKTAEEVAKGNVTGAKAARALNKETQKSLKALKEENKLNKAALFNRKSLALSAKTAARRATEAARFELKGSRLLSGESKVVKGAGNVGQKAAEALPGSSGLGPSGFGGGAMGALGAAGPWGAVLGAMLKVGSAVANKNREAAIAVTQRFLNYSVESQEGLEGQVDQVKNAFVQAGDATAKFNGDLEATQSAMARIWTSTGAEVKNVGDNIGLLEEMRFLGLGSIDELADNAIKRMNQAGMSFGEAAMEMKALTLQVQALNFEGGENVVQMDDFYKGVQELSEGIESMNVDQIALGKSFATNLKIGKKLGLTYERNIAAAKGLTRALTDNYDEGFATLEVQDDLAAAMQSKNAKGELTQVAKDAAKIADDLNRGFITQDRAAEMLKEIGGTTDERVIQERIRRAAESGTVLPMLEARLGKLSFDQLQVFKDIQQRVSAGEDLAEILPSLSAKDRAAYDSAVNKAAEKQLDPAKTANLLLDKILVTLSEVLPDMLSGLNETLKGITKLITWAMKKLKLDPEGMEKKSEEEKKEEHAEKVSETKQMMLNRIKSGLGSEASGLSDTELFQKLAGSSKEAVGLRRKAIGSNEFYKEAMTEVLDAKGVGGKGAGENLFNLAQRETAARIAAKEAPPTPTKVNLEGGKMGADGTERGTATVEYTRPGAAKSAEQANNVNKAAANATKPQAPIR